MPSAARQPVASRAAVPIPTTNAMPHERHTRDQLPGSVPSPRRSPRSRARGGQARARRARQGSRPRRAPRGQRSPASRTPRTSAASRSSREDIDLAKAYAIRAQREKDERIAAERLKQEEARLRREAKAKLAELLKDKALNDAERRDRAPLRLRRQDQAHPCQRRRSSRRSMPANWAWCSSMAATCWSALPCWPRPRRFSPPAVALKVDPDAPARGRSLRRSAIPGARRPGLVT